MEIYEAIETLIHERSEHHSFRTDIKGQALTLGIEALQRVQDCRAGLHYQPGSKLPSESED